MAEHNFVNIGFLEKPNGLEEFLLNDGYKKVDEQSDEKCTIYIHEEELNPILYYFPGSLKERCGEITAPNWKEKGFEVVSDLVIDCYGMDALAVEEEIRLFHEILRKYSAIRYDSDCPDIFLGSKDALESDYDSKEVFGE